MTEDMIRYDLLAQEALRGVVKKVLQDTAKGGLHGEHHFYIAFDTNYAGVRLSQRLREQYPNEMTIVLQHQFWDLTVSDHAFEVGLSFGNVPERLVIPYDAIKGFFDPSVQFGLQFEIIDLDDENAEDDSAGEEDGQDNIEGSDNIPAGKAKKPVKGKTKKLAAKAPEGTGTDVAQMTPKAKPASGKKGDTPPDGPGAEVVSLDKFRKPKN